MVAGICDGGGPWCSTPMPRASSCPRVISKHTGARLAPPITPALEAEVNMRRMDAAREFAALPDRIRGYERIKERSVEVAKRAAEGKLAALEAAALAASAR